MNTRFVTWTIVAMCSTGVAACGSDSPSIPTAPTVSTPPPAPTPQPPPRALAVDLRGDYTLTFEVGSGCAHVPKELRTRTYQARIEYWKSAESTDLFFAELSGSRFHRYHPIAIDVTGNSVNLDLSDNVILEEPSPEAYFATAGYGVASVQPTELSTISGSLRGFFNYCALTPESGVENQCSLDAVVRNLCLSEDSRWTLTRR